MRGSYPSTSPATSAGGTPPDEVAGGTADPETWTGLLQLGGQTLPAGDFGTLHVYAMCAMAPPAAGSADLSVTLAGAPNPVVVGQPLTYTMGVANAGPTDATGVVATATLPANATFVSATSTAGSCAPSAATVTCDVGPLASGASATATIVMTPTQPVALTAGASVSGGQPDPNSTNNTASVTTMANLASRAAPTLTAAPGNGTLGGTITDQVTLGGGSSPTGTISFKLYGPGDTSCTVALASSSATVTGDGAYSSAPYTATTAGTYRWIASYGGDGANVPVGPGACGAPSQTVSVRAVPTLTVGTLGAKAAGGVIASQATLAGGTVITGTITISLYGPGDTTCAKALASTTAAVSGNGIYGSNGFTATRSGTYRWVAAYSGDALNVPLGTPCGAPGATVTLSAPAALPASLFSLTAPKADRDGRISFAVRGPGRGEFRAVAEVAISVAATRKPELIRYGAVALTARAAGRFDLEIAPDTRSKTLRREHTSLRVTITVTFTPTGGKPRTREIHVTVKGTRQVKR